MTMKKKRRQVNNIFGFSNREADRIRDEVLLAFLKSTDAQTVLSLAGISRTKQSYRAFCLGRLTEIGKKIT